MHLYCYLKQGPLEVGVEGWDGERESMEGSWEEEGEEEEEEEDGGEGERERGGIASGGHWSLDKILSNNNKNEN